MQELDTEGGRSGILGGAMLLASHQLDNGILHLNSELVSEDIVQWDFGIRFTLLIAAVRVNAEEHFDTQFLHSPWRSRTIL